MADIRVWGKQRTSDWNQYWRLGRVMEKRVELSQALNQAGISSIDVCAWIDQPPRQILIDRELEVFSHDGIHVDWICEVVHALTGLTAKPSPAANILEFQKRAREKLLYVRHNFEPWDEKLPCFILGYDFDQGNGIGVSPVQPENWRMVDHQTDGLYIDRRYMAAMILEPTPKGQELLDELSVRFDAWFEGAGCHGRPPLDAILDYRNVLAQYGVDCNNSFHDGLEEAWYPIDIETPLELERARPLIATPLPERLSLLLMDEEGNPPPIYRSYFHFTALTLNSD